MTRDLLRSELAECAIDSVMLDGVSRNQHYDLLVNNPYNLVLSRQSEYSDIQDEALF
jgi:hypothetical protein